MLTKEKGKGKMGTYTSSRERSEVRNAEIYGLASSSKNKRNSTKNSEAGKKNSPSGSNDGKKKKKKRRPKQYNNLNEMDKNIKEALRVSEIFIVLSFISLFKLVKSYF
jgi:hypothetical protein